MNNLKFVIFLSEQHMNKKKYKVCGKNYEQRLYNKGIVAINYYNWKEYFTKNGIIVPTFDINDNMPSHGVIYKKFTDSKYLSLENYDNVLFKEQCRALSTLVSYLGASSIQVKRELNENNSRKIDANLKVMSEVELNAKNESSSDNTDNLLGIKTFDESVEYFIKLGCKKFDRCASSGGLFGVDKDIYKRLRLINIVSERFNGQKQSFFTITKKFNSRDLIEIGAFINKLNIGASFSYDNIKHSDKSYTFVIDYHSLEDLIIIKKNACIMNRAKSVDEEDDSSSEEEDSLDVEFKEILAEYKKTKDKKKSLIKVKNFVTKCAEIRGIAAQFHQWKNKKQTNYNTRCQWLKSMCDIDYFFRDIGLIK